MLLRYLKKIFYNSVAELRMTKKKLPVRFTGQHFTIDKVLIKDAIRQANISNQDTVLDIGAGKGFLTVHLLKIANNVVAIENDTALVEHLRKLFSDARNVQVVGCDFRNFAVPKFPFKVVSNIPYGITSDIFKILMFESLGNFLGGSIVLQLEPTQKLFSRKLYNPYTVFYHTFFDLKLVYPYIRMMAGPVDYTPGAMRNATKADWRAMYSTPASMGTRCHQLAAYIVHDSPFTMLCDAPTNYLNEQECVDFITSLPVETDSTFIASGELGKYIVTVRKKDVNWYVGGMTNWDRRDVELDFSFLPEGVRYMATLFVDGINADKQAEDYRMEKRIVDRESRMKLHLASGGGFAMKLELCPLRGRVTAVPEGKGIPSFYKKYIETEGLYVTSSERVSDEALLKACDIISLMLAKRPDVKAHMVKRGCHVMVIGKDEETCDLPEFAHICNCEDSIKYWNWRARGFGGAPEDELSSSCGEENLLALPQDKYVGENILIHEFAHLIHTVGIVGVEPGFNDRLEALRQNAIRKGLWKDTYAVSNKEEYFAECVQSFFNCNRYADPANGVHNWVNRRAKLKSYDPDMYRLLQEYFYEIEIPVNNIVHK